MVAIVVIMQGRKGDKAESKKQHEEHILTRTLSQIKSKREKNLAYKKTQ